MNAFSYLEALPVSSPQAILFLSKLHNINVHEVQQDIFIACRLIPTNPQLQPITGQFWQSCAKPQGVVKLTVGIGGATSFSIPQRISRIHSSKRPAWSWIASCTKVIVANKQRNLVRPVNIGVCTVTNFMLNITWIAFCVCSIKWPDMLPCTSTSMGEGDSINVCTFQSNARIEGIRHANLVGINPSTDPCIGWWWKSDRATGSSRSTTTSYWIVSEPQSWWALLVEVAHVKVSYSVPLPRTTTWTCWLAIEDRNNCISQDRADCCFCISFYIYLVNLLRRRTGSIVNSFNRDRGVAALMQKNTEEHLNRQKQSHDSRPAPQV